jgi:serine/threonine protein kinase
MNEENIPKKSIENHIRKGQIAEALGAFGEFLDYCADARKEWIQIQGWYSGVHRDKMLGVVGQESDMEVNKITRSLIEKITDFEREILPDYFERKDFAYHIGRFNDLDTFNVMALNALLAGRSYQIVNRDEKKSTVEKIGEGNSTISYLAYDSNIKEYAIVQVFKNENSAKIPVGWIDSLMNLKHRNIIRTYDHSLKSYPRFVIKEYIHGITLEQAINKTGKRPVSQVAWWLYQLTDALIYLQQKRVVHYNIRPSKIFVDDEWKMVISPFDLILMEDSDGRVSLNRFLSICKYVGPESLQLLAVDSFHEHIGSELHSVKKGERWDDAADMQFSLGAIAFFAITGEELFPGSSVYSVFRARDQFDRDPDLRKLRLSLMDKYADNTEKEGKSRFLSIVERLLDVNPENRYKSLAELLHQIHPLLQNEVYEGNELQDSYRRALVNNSELIRDFYASLLEKSEISRKMFGAGGQDNTIKLRRQQAILQMTIDILIMDDDAEREKEIRSKILNSPHHGGFNEDLYGLFLDTLISTILDSDPLYHEKQDLLHTWKAVKIKFLSLLKSSGSHIK